MSQLPRIVEDLNNTPLTKLGNLTPNSIHSEADSVLVNEERQKVNIPHYSEPNFSIQRKNQVNYEKETKLLQVNDYVYLDFDEKLFDKSFDVSVSSQKYFKIFASYQNSTIFSTYFVMLTKTKNLQIF